MVKTTAIETRAVRCDRCGEIIYTCDRCKDYFSAGNVIDCQMDYHYCRSCWEDKEVKKEMKQAQLSRVYPGYEVE